jgi:TPR repeat protein
MSLFQSILYLTGIGYDSSGFNRNGYDQYGFDAKGYDSDGYDKGGWSQDGINLYTVSFYDKQGYAKDGFNKDGYDRDGWNKNNIHKVTKTKYDLNGYDKSMHDKDGWCWTGIHKVTKTKIDLDGYTKDGFPPLPVYYRQGLDRKKQADEWNRAYDCGFNRNGWNRDGWNKEGINKHTGENTDKNGHSNSYDADGWSEGGWNRLYGVHKDTACRFDKNGCTKDGFCNPAVVNVQKNGKKEYDLAIRIIHYDHDYQKVGELSRLTELAAKEGHAQAQYLLGLLFELGKFVPLDKRTGERGILVTLAPLPQAMYFDPSPSSLTTAEDGEPPNYKKAIIWYILAAKQGHTTAGLRLKNLDSSVDITNDGLQLSETQKKIKEYIENRGIDKLIHFTQYKNIESILKHGLMTRSNLDSLSIKYYFNDRMRLDNRENSISLSISYPNHIMLWKYSRDEHCVILVLEPSILWEYDCAFCGCNAATRIIKKTPIDSLRGLDALKYMFETDEEEEELRKSERIKSCDPTDEQAEVLVFDDIPIDKVIGIHFTPKNNKYRSEYSDFIKNIAETSEFKNTGIKVMLDKYFFDYGRGSV